jgi:hypothetical protein
MFLNSLDSDVKRINRDPGRVIKIFVRKIAAHAALSFLLPFLMVLIGRGILLMEVPPPQPLIQDEFSYLLAGETFASFRLTNPPHPLWEHFETIHELMQPTYMSKYPPMQGIFLAFGQLIFGTPWMGVLLSMAIFCGLLPWVFRAWIPCDWALIGALLATYKIGVLSYWTDSYWGGSAAAIGGALVLGSIKRLSIRSTSGMAIIFALGASILANSRPFEGLVIVIGCTGYLFWNWFGSGRLHLTWPSYPRCFLPAACLVAFPVLLAMGFYNYRITGNITEFPYQAFEKQYAVWTPFVWQQKSSPEPLYRHDFIRREWIDWDGTHKAYERNHWIRVHWESFLRIVHFYFGPAFFLGGFLFIPALCFGAKNRSILGLLAFYYSGTSILSDAIPHYTAPATALIYLAVTAALRTGWHFVPFGFPIGKWLLLWVLILFWGFTTELRTDPDNRFLYYKPHFMEKRRQVLSVLERQPGLQLVFVYHGPLHDLNEVWTYNKPNIDAARIVWVNSMTPAENQRVLDYYGHTRTAWMLDDDAELTLRPYDNPTAEPLVRIKNPLLPPPLEN